MFGLMLARAGNSIRNPLATACLGCNSNNKLRARHFTAKRIDGKKISQDIWQEVAAEVATIKRKPGLAVVLVGGRGDSASYVKLKYKAAETCGFTNISLDLPEDVKQSELLEVVENLNNDPKIDGVLVQLPLPEHLDQKVILRAIDKSKDVDGFHPYNLGGLARRGEELRQVGRNFEVGRSHNVPCTPLGCIELLDRYGVVLKGKKVVVLGRSNIVGLPMALLLMHKHATVTVCHSHTPNIKEVCREADILIAAIGRGEMVRGDWVKPGAVVLDVGVNFVPDASRKSGQRMCGDVHYKEVAEVASLLTPVPGGIGPMTVAMLMKNTLSNCKRNIAREEGAKVTMDRKHQPERSQWPPSSINTP